MRVNVFYFFPLLSVALTVLLGDQAHEWHEACKQSIAQGCLGRWGQSTGGRRVRRGFRQELAPVKGIGVNVAKIDREGWLRSEAGNRVMAAWVNVADQRAVRAAATLCWRMVGACLALAPARLLMKAAASSLHLPRVYCFPAPYRSRKWLGSLRASRFDWTLLRDTAEWRWKVHFFCCLPH